MSTVREYRKLLYKVRNPNPSDLWQVRHLDAITNPRMQREYPIVTMLDGWLQYADNHCRQFESQIGDDGVLGPHWESIGDALRGLLNGDCGRLDCGTLDGIILDAMQQAGIKTEDK